MAIKTHVSSVCLKSQVECEFERETSKVFAVLPLSNTVAFNYSFYPQKFYFYLFCNQFFGAQMHFRVFKQVFSVYVFVV